MNQSKPWYTSITIWGAIIAFASPPLGALFHTTFTSDQMNSLAALLAQFGAQMQAVGPMIGGIIAWIGRIRATAQIGGDAPSAPKSL